ncbi:MAG: DUF1553 domain-containing protein [Verrucomicrobiales bacterium]
MRCLFQILLLTLILVQPTVAEMDIAKAREFWSLQPVTDPRPPAVRNFAWMNNDLDRFVLAKHEAKGLAAVPKAGPLSLLRRATFDLTGFPPTLHEIDAFLADRSPDAFVKVIDRLLGLPAYGERWGRHWLDGVRYADTAGCNSDFPVPSAYKYRNWVIDAVNRDMPYHEFVRWQLAGDLLPANTPEDRFHKTIATGYLATSRRFGSRLDDLHLTIEDTIDNVGKTLLGLSVSCARCHDHKFDPITVQDYYALYGIFRSTRYAFPGVEIYPSTRDFAFNAPPEEVAKIRARERALAELDQRIEDLKNERTRLEREAQRPPAATQPVLGNPGRTLAEVRAEWEAAKERHKGLRNTRDQFEKAYAVQDTEQPANAPVHLKGDPKSPGDEVPRGFLQVLGGQRLPPDAKGSGRLELAQWITEPTNPLTARVMVNRVWQHHFGRGLVTSVDDFGTRGEPPSHPELLDWLASRFVEGGWSLKKLHRLIMTSHTYQLSCHDSSQNAALDNENRLYWRFNHRRLSAEEVRDAMLASSGELDQTVAAGHPFPPENTWKFTQHKPFVSDFPTNKRSVYLMQQRIRKQPFLAIFDGADTNVATGQRPLTTTPLQALFMMNDPFAHAKAAAFADRVCASGADTQTRLSLAYRLAFGRLPTAEETAAATAHIETTQAALASNGVTKDKLDQQAWQSLSRVLFSANEFVFLD